MQHRYVAIRDMSMGNESVGEMWKETKIFPSTATIEEVMDWALDRGEFSNKSKPSNRNVVITQPHEDSK